MSGNKYIDYWEILGIDKYIYTNTNLIKERIQYAGTFYRLIQDLFGGKITQFP